MSNFIKALQNMAQSASGIVIGSDPNCMICKEDVYKPIYGMCDLCYEKMPFASDGLIGGCLSVCRYEPPVKQMIYDYKYNDERYIGKYMALMMGAKFLESGLTADLIMVAPSSEKRRRIRGFDHILYIAEILSDNLGIKNGAQILARNKETQRLKGLTKAERLKELESVFVVTDPEAIKGKRILLIDDILTTGATLSACTEELMKYEPKTVLWLTFAMVV